MEWPSQAHALEEEEEARAAELRACWRRRVGELQPYGLRSRAGDTLARGHKLAMATRAAKQVAMTCGRATRRPQAALRAAGCPGARSRWLDGRETAHVKRTKKKG